MADKIDDGQSQRPATPPPPPSPPKRDNPVVMTIRVSESEGGRVFSEPKPSNPTPKPVEGEHKS